MNPTWVGFANYTLWPERSHHDSLQPYWRLMSRVVQDDFERFVIWLFWMTSHTGILGISCTRNLSQASLAQFDNSSVPHLRGPWLHIAPPASLLLDSRRTEVAEIPNRQPSTCTSCSAVGSRQTKTVSELRPSFRLSNTSWCSLLQAKRLAFSKPLRRFFHKSRIVLNCTGTSSVLSHCEEAWLPW